MPLRLVVLLCCLWLAVALAGASSPALATQCTVGNIDLSFGSVDTLSSTGSTATATLSINCDEVPGGIDAVTVCGHLGPGTGGTSGGVRQLLSGSNTLGFGLYTDAGNQVPWGHGSYPELGEPFRLTLGVSGGAASEQVTLRGLVFGSQTGTVPGSYTATLTESDARFAYDDGDLSDCTDMQMAETNISVTADVPANCLVETGDLNFGTVGVIDQNLDAIADILVSCTPETTYSIALDGGISGATEPDQRLMRAGDRTLTYGLYLDALRSEPWGEGASVKSGEGSGSQQTIPVYGRVPPQPVAVGSYSDTVIVTITYD
jgi:spore coat protein U-like protein